MNGQFDYVMALVSIILGLGITHVLSAFGSAVHRLRGHGRPIHLEATYLLWVAYVLIWMVGFWWWEFKFKVLGTQWTFGLYLFVIFYAVLLFLLAVILVPKDMEGLDDSYAYFMSGRRWFFGLFLFANLVDIGDSFFKGIAWGLDPTYLAQLAAYGIGSIVGIHSEKRSIQLGVAVTMLAVQTTYTWDTLNILGGF
jgi:hypothetical protein